LIVSYLGPNIRGATRWIMIAGFQLQPSELVKPVLILFFAWLISKYPPREIKNIPIHIVLFILPFLLVFKQPDLGSSLVYMSVWIAMMLGGGLSVKFFISASFILSLIVPFAWHSLAGYQRNRFETFINPYVDPKGAGYNALQSAIAVGSGQIFGKGLGRGTQSHLRFLPEFHTDFIFATLIEELGFIGGILLFATYCLLLWRLIMLMWQWNHNLFLFSYATGLFAMIISQTFINIGMNMGLLPITGITLPFVSYGGSSLLSLSISFGMLWSMIYDRDEHDSVAFS
jgi:rod shape determining protein RodA